MKVIIAGGRDFNNLKLMQDTLMEILEHEPDLEIVSGMAKGADMMGLGLAKANGIDYKEFPANWQDMSEPCRVGENQFGRYNKLAGMKRNHQMGDYADMAIVFWDGNSSGSNDMIEYMRELEKIVYVIKY